MKFEEWMRQTPIIHETSIDIEDLREAFEAGRKAGMLGAAEMMEKFNNGWGPLDIPKFIRDAAAQSPDETGEG